MRTTEDIYKEVELDDDSISDEEILDALCEFPSLLQRPIVVFAGKAIIGRPPIKVLDLFA
jgi:arsenate reductase